MKYNEVQWSAVQHARPKEAIVALQYRVATHTLSPTHTHIQTPTHLQQGCDVALSVEDDPAQQLRPQG